MESMDNLDLVAGDPDGAARSAAQQASNVPSDGAARSAAQQASNVLSPGQGTSTA
jgi:hypothetical protein